MDNQEILVNAFTEMAPKYEQKVDQELKRFWGWSYQSFIHLILDSIPFNPNDNILDVATGTSVIPRELINRNHATGQIVGLDLTFAMLQQSKPLMVMHQERLMLTCASALQIPLQSNYFDLVTCGLAAHHMDVPALLAELRRVLKPGGKFIVADVSASPTWRNWFISAILRAGAFAYFLSMEGFSRAIAEAQSLSHIFTADEWMLTLARLGFTELQITRLPVNHFWSPVPLILQATKKP